MCHSTHSMSFQRGVFQAIDFAGTGNEKQVAQLWQRDRATAVLCLCLKSSLCSCRQLLYVRPALHRTCLCREVGVFRRGASLSPNISDGRGCRPPITVGVKKLEWLPFVWYQNICNASFNYFVTILSSDIRIDRRTDGRTDGRSCDRNTVRCITYSCTVKTLST